MSARNLDAPVAREGGKTVVVIGSGGREHALAWKLSLSPEISRLIVAPGNDGMDAKWERWETTLSGREEFARLARRAREERVDLVVVGPDNPLADGIVDVMTEHGVAVFGPTAAAARIEASKAFAKDVMKSAGVPTAEFVVAPNADEARRYLRSAPWGGVAGGRTRGWVVKADGLALGKGVHVCGTLEEGVAAVDKIVALATDSPKLVIEERLTGEEISWFALCDGERVALMEPARDYKRVRDGNEGPNTGGMGAFSPVPGLPDGLEARVRREVFEPVLAEMRRRGCPFRGVLYAGLMWDAASAAAADGGLWVIEFNARFGDPETQVVVPRVEGDLLPWLEAVARGDLSQLPARVPFSREPAVYVVGAARGYPEQPEKGRTIAGVAPAPEVFCAGVKRAPGGSPDASGGALVSNGGRVLGALGRGATLAAARAQAYERLARVSFEGMHYRTDVALKEASR